MQRSVALEKACVLFNIGSSYSQSAAAEPRDSPQSLARAVKMFQNAAGVFQYILENFRNAPSADMSQPSLRMLVSLMLAQGQVCARIKEKKNEEKKKRRKEEEEEEKKKQKKKKKTKKKKNSARTSE